MTGKKNTGSSSRTPQAQAIASDVPPNWFMMYLQQQQESKQQLEEETRRREEENRKQQMDQFQQMINAFSNVNSTDNNQTNRPSTSTIKAPNTPRPNLLDVDCTYSKFRAWRNAYNDYYMLQRMDTQTLQVQKADFRCCLTEAMKLHIKCAIEISDHNELSIEEILDQIQEYLRQKRNVALDRVAFDERKQETGETFDEFYVSIRKLSEEADLCDNCVEQRLTTKIMSSLKNTHVRQKLLAITPFPDLKTVVNICRSEESAYKDSNALNSKICIERVSQYKSDKKKWNQNSTVKNNENKSSNSMCKRCGLYHNNNSKCPAYNSTCLYCSKVGHWTKVCMKKKFNQSKKSNNNKQENEKSIKGLIVADIQSGSNTPKIILNCSPANEEGNLIKVKATPDTGADISVCGTNLLINMGLQVNKKRKPMNSTVKAANGTIIKTKGIIRIKMQLEDNIIYEDVVVCDNQEELLLSWKTCKKLHLIPQDFPNPIKKTEVISSIINEHGLKEDINKIMEDFNDVFADGESLQNMKGDPMKIHLDEKAECYSMKAPRNIPYGWRDEVKQQLDDMVKKNIIRPLGDEPTNWCSPMVVVGKPNGNGVRICVDLTKLNKYVKRPNYPLTSPKEAVSSILPGSKYFSIFDATHGYWQLALEEKSQLLTTFMTPYGRYAFLRAPMGLSCTGDEYCRRGDQAFQGIKNLQKVVDDIILYDDNLETHLQNVKKFLQRCRENQITLNPRKCKVAQESVQFAGYIINSEGISADPNKVKTISNFPVPKNITDLRSFMGLVNQIGYFSPNISKSATPLRSLMSDKNIFKWSNEHNEAFNRVKEALCEPPILNHYDPNKPTMVQTDASRLNGLGYALLQKHEDNWRLIQCGSRFISDTESRYATIELEMLAIVYALRKCSLYLKGLKEFQVITDHKPLLTILNKKGIDEIENPRIQRYKESLQSYNFKTEWRQGKLHSIPDALSRAPVDNHDDEDKQNEEHTENTINMITSTIINQLSTEEYPFQDQVIKDIREQALQDEEYTKLYKTIQQGFPETKLKASGIAQSYWSARHQLSTDNGLVLVGKRILIPKACRKDVLKRLHLSHQGIERTKQRARQTVFWPCINSDITNLISSCEKCQEIRSSQPNEPMFTEITPTRIFEETSTDLFSYAGKEYLVYSDRFSGWPTIFQFNQGETKTKQIIYALRKCFADLGVPIRLRTDGGPQFTSRDFKKFMATYGINHQLSTPYYPKGN